MKILFTDMNKMITQTETERIEITMKNGMKYFISDDAYHVLTLHCDGELFVHPKASNMIKLTEE